MALTPAEKQRRFREREKERAKTLPDMAQRYVTRSFSAFLVGDGGWSNELSFIGETMNSFGMDVPDLTKDVDPEWSPDWCIDNLGSLGRAERMVDGWIDSAKQLAELINTFKIQEIDRAIEILSGSDLSDPEAKKQAFKDVVQLNTIKARLQKQVRHAFHATTVKGG